MILKFAFGCQARVGKDIACTYLQKKYGGNIYHFSDPLYKILHYAQDVCGFPHSKDVKFLQWIGTEWGRSQNDSVWINTTLKNISNEHNSFVGDLRFPNELEALRKNGFVCVRIIRKDRPIDRNATHPSETALADYEEWDDILTNDGSIEDLHLKLDALVTKYKKHA